MKKGFTLIELLAVILILGIIALIAIPTVNKIISEARYGAFKSSNDNIMKTIEQTCQTSLIKGENPVLSYIFTDGVSNNKIDVKGSLPNDGYIFLDRDCNVTDYYLADNKNIYSNGEDVRSDYMLKAPIEGATSIFKTLYSDYYDSLLSINVIKNLDIPNNAIEVKDPSISENDKIKSWLVPNGENYDLYIGSLEKIYTNYDSSFLFNGLNNVTSYSLNNLDTVFSKNFAYLFAKNHSLSTIDVNNFNTENVTNLQAIFSECTNLKNIDLSNWDTSNVTDMSNMFYNCHLLKSIDLSSFNTSKVIHIYSMFHHCKSLTALDLSNFDVSKATNFTNFLINCAALKILKINNFKFTNANSFLNMVNNCYELEKIYLNNIDAINILINYLPSRESSTTGLIYVEGDKTNIDISTFNSKNWNVI